MWVMSTSITRARLCCQARSDGVGQGIERGLARVDGAQQPVLLVALADAIEGRIGKGAQRQQQAEQEGEQQCDGVS
jgi:hypothetical protein